MTNAAEHSAAVEALQMAEACARIAAHNFLAAGNTTAWFHSCEIGLRIEELIVKTGDRTAHPPARPAVDNDDSLRGFCGCEEFES